MHWLDIVLIVLLIIFAFSGLWKGLLRSALDLVNWLVSFVAAIFLARPITMLFNIMFNASDKLGANIGNALAKIGSLGTPLTEATAAGPLINGTDGINFFLKKIMGKLAGDGVIAAGSTPAQYFGSLLGGICMLLISGLIAFIIIRLIVFLLSKLFKFIKRNGLINWVDKILGFAFGAVKGFVIVGVGFFVLSFFKWIPAINNTIEKTTVAKTLNEWSLKTADFIGKKIDLKKLLNGIVKNSYEETTASETNETKNVIASEHFINTDASTDHTAENTFDKSKFEFSAGVAKNISKLKYEATQKSNYLENFSITF